MEYISMIIGLAIVVTMMVRGWNPVIIGIAAAAAVIFLNGMPYGDTMTDVFFPAFAVMFETLFPIIFSGSLIAETYKPVSYTHLDVYKRQGETYRRFICS